MEFFMLVGIAIGLSLDAFAVAFANSTVIHDLELKHGLRMAVFFGFFQMIMPFMGWAAGTTFSQYIQGVDHWIAFGLLAIVGGRMIWSGLPFTQEKDSNSCSDERPQDCRHLPTLLMLSIATSIDALAVGVSFAMMKLSILEPVIVIGVVTFAISLVGYFLGTKLRKSIDLPLEVIGGIVLVGIGLKILFADLFPG